MVFGAKIQPLGDGSESGETFIQLGRTTTQTEESGHFPLTC
jgi:hypothetical protein